MLKVSNLKNFLKFVGLICVVIALSTKLTGYSRLGKKICSYVPDYFVIFVPEI